jgi:glucokinase
MAYIFGVDIGGTKIAVAAVSLQGEILARAEIETRAAEGASRVIARLSDALHSIQQIDQLLGIGIGCTGPVDPRTGHVMNPYTLPTWDDVDIVLPLAGEFRTRVALENDCDAAALGEHWMGAAKDTKNAVYITVGTGIGAGIILNSKLYRGVGMTAGEIGHMTIENDGVPCYCGSRGCLEMYAAGPAIAKAYEIKTGAQAISAREVIERAQRGDADARQIVEQTAYYLGVGLGNLITILAPDVIVLGGGVMTHFDLFYPAMRATISKNVALVPAAQVNIVPAALGQNAGVTGAAGALLERINNGF